MKRIATTIILFSLIIYLPNDIFSQAKCKVMVKSISETYEGKCKKGLANGKGIATGIDTYQGRFTKGYPDGKGTYTWASGAEYIGQWEFGKRSGLGIYIFKYNGMDSIQEGVWKDDKYMGPEPPPPSIIQLRNIQKYSFLKVGDLNKLSIDIYMNGATNSTIEDLTIVSSNGSYQIIGNTIVFNDIIYPCSFKVSYLTWNKFHSERLNAVIEFEISEPGDWWLKLYN